jgi:hypothetical protein
VEGSDQDTRTARLTPDTMIDGIEFYPAVVAGIQLLAVNDQLAVEQMQLFDASMAVGRIVGARREPHQLADAMSLRICGEQRTNR